MKAMLVCSTGGHLAELLHWSQRLRPVPDATVWVTHERANAEQISALYPAAEVRFVAPVEPRQAGVAARMLPTARRLLRECAPDVVVTTGAAVAVPFAVAARMARVPFHYLESAARFSRPSLTGRIVSRIHRERLWCQVVPPWPGWRYAGSLFDSYTSESAGAAGAIRRVVVSLGTQANFGFRTALSAVVRTLAELDTPPQVLWQIGSTDVSGLGLQAVRRHVPEPDLIEAMRAADVVITHAGVGLSALAMDCGHVPVVIPRRAARAEHTDDHQIQLADFLRRRGLAVSVEADELNHSALSISQARRIVRAPFSTLTPLVLT